MSTADLNIEYNARKTVANHAEFAARWEDEAAKYRNEAAGELDIAYGNSERERYDFFPAPHAGRHAPLCAYIHGGYWRSRDRKTFSHIAKGLNERGICVAIPSYDLAPQVTVMEIVEQMRAFLVKLWRETDKHPVVAGNSAGGHLAGAMLATDWSRVEGAPSELVTSAFALSGLYDLEPLLETDINDDVRLTRETAREASPIHWPAPGEGLKFVAAVGALESGVFKDQSHRIADAWRGRGIETEYLEVPGCHHFSIVDAVSTPGHMLFERLA
ncbi:MAG: alpha/beta hydrolase, partial [Methyloligellaceae bacterium]